MDPRSGLTRIREGLAAPGEGGFGASSLQRGIVRMAAPGEDGEDAPVDADSLYGEDYRAPGPAGVAAETELGVEDEVEELDRVLDAEEAEEAAAEAKKAATKITEADDDDDDEVWISDDVVEVESDGGSSDEETVLEEDGVPVVKGPATVAEDEAKKPGGGTGGFAYALSKASATFYKAFKKPSVKVPVKSPPAVEADVLEDKPTDMKSRADALELSHTRLEQLIEAQIATLNTAKTGFVDLRLLRPMTERTLQAVETDARALLSDYGELERRAADLEKASEAAQRAADDDVAAKEQLLISAKLSLAEARSEVESLRHELRTLQKQLADPARAAARERAELSRRRDAAAAAVAAGTDARIAAEIRLERRRESLERERAETTKLEKGYRDIEGDWA